MEILETLSVTTTFVIKENGTIIDLCDLGAKLPEGRIATKETMIEDFNDYCQDVEGSATLEMVVAIEYIEFVGGDSRFARDVTVDLISEFKK